VRITELRLRKEAKMKELFRERDLTKIVFYQSLLEDSGISTFVKNENISTTQGGLNPDFFPALCIVNDSDDKRARQLIQNQLQHAGNVPNTEMVCGACGEMVPSSFDTCWNCQSPII
jgi:Putative prokaryotic signal transducing protein